MRDEPYPAERLGAYGAREQPAIVARMRPHLRLTQVGNVAAVAAVGLAIGALVTFPVFDSARSGIGWSRAVLVCSIVLLVICGYQLVVWQRAMSAWSGRRINRLDGLATVSWWLHVASYAVVLVALWASISASRDAGWSAVSATLQALTLLAMVAAQVLAAVQYLRSTGPPGTVPAHMRQLIQRETAKADRATNRRRASS